MHELLNIRTGKTLKFASDIDELTSDQYLYYLELALLYLNGELREPMELKRRLFVKLTDLKVSKKMMFYKSETQHEIWDALNDKINLLDSFFDLEENETGKTLYHLHLNCAVNLLPEWNGFYAERTLIDTITLGELIQCLDNLRSIRKAVAEENIEEAKIYSRELFHALYKPKGVVTSLKKIPENVTFHTINYFTYFWEIITTYPLTINGSEIDFSIIFPDPEDEEDAEKKNAKAKKGDIGWNGVAFDIAETGVFGNMEQVMKEKFITILLFLYKQKRDSDEMKELLKKQSNG